MSVVPGIHEAHGARFRDRGDRRVVAHYGRPERAHRAVRAGVGVIEPGYDWLAVDAADRDAVAAAVPLPDGGGRGRYVVVAEADSIVADGYVFDAGDRLLFAVAPGRGDAAAAVLPDRVTVRTPDIAGFGVHGPHATEKVASVTPAAAPDDRLSFVRAAVGDAAATVIRTDAPTGEPGYEVVCDAGDAADLFDTLCNRGLNAAPFGHRTWESLTLEAGTPLFEPDLRGRPPSVVGALAGFRASADADPRIVGLRSGSVPAPGAAVSGGLRGTVTRAAVPPSLGEPAALAVVREAGGGPVGIEGVDDARLAPLPFVDGTERSGRCPA